jgi:hypothetical protein
MSTLTSHGLERPPADSSRLAEAARLLSLVNGVSDDDWALLDQIGDCLNRLRASRAASHLPCSPETWAEVSQLPA